MPAKKGQAPLGAHNSGYHPLLNHPGRKTRYKAEDLNVIITVFPFCGTPDNESPLSGYRPTMRSGEMPYAGVASNLTFQV